MLRRTREGEMEQLLAGSSTAFEEAQWEVATPLTALLGLSEDFGV